MFNSYIINDRAYCLTSNIRVLPLSAAENNIVSVLEWPNSLRDGFPGPPTHDYCILLVFIVGLSGLFSQKLEVLREPGPRQVAPVADPLVLGSSNYDTKLVGHLKSF